MREAARATASTKANALTAPAPADKATISSEEPPRDKDSKNQKAHLAGIQKSLSGLVTKGRSTILGKKKQHDPDREEQELGTLLGLRFASEDYDEISKIEALLAKRELLPLPQVYRSRLVFCSTIIQPPAINQYCLFPGCIVWSSGHQVFIFNGMSDMSMSTPQTSQTIRYYITVNAKADAQRDGMNDVKTEPEEPEKEKPDEAPAAAAPAELIHELSKGQEALEGLHPKANESPQNKTDCTSLGDGKCKPIPRPQIEADAQRKGGASEASVCSSGCWTTQHCYYQSLSLTTASNLII